MKLLFSLGDRILSCPGDDTMWTSSCGSPTHTTQAIVCLQPSIRSSGDGTSFHLQQPMEADGGTIRSFLEKQKDKNSWLLPLYFPLDKQEEAIVIVKLPNVGDENGATRIDGRKIKIRHLPTGACSHLRCLAWMLLARCVLGKLQVHCLVKHVCPKVNIQKDNGVRMKIIGTHVDATEIVYDEDS
ncbi:hypothetical protein Zm00014a_027266 [Zea mays]|uniref:Uncharacterized protein n=1 Tax=Zea mays TaxID=4577 RepID=A0A317Y2D4_MAIZE|nr:hypothetical protein Zm00014a_027266 [Zea mays]